MPHDDRVQPYGGYYDPYDVAKPSTDVWEEDKDYFSGLYDAEGRPLYKPKFKMGFIK